MTRSIEIDGRIVILEVHHNGFEWTAIDDATYEPGCPIGLGTTAQAAIDDWVEQINSKATEGVAA